MDIPSTVRPAREAEKARDVGVQKASHVYVREGAVIGPLDTMYRGGGYRVAIRHVLRPIPRAGAGEKEVVAGDRGHADVDLCGLFEAAHWRSGTSSGTAASMWTPAQALIVL